MSGQGQGQGQQGGQQGGQGQNPQANPQPAPNPPPQANPPVNPPNRPEIKIGQPLPFDGITNKGYARRFLASCEAYCRLNQHIYTVDDEKILFALSFMQEGPAGDWANNLIDEAAITGTYGTWQTFRDTFTRKFISDNEEKHAIEAITTIKQGSETVEDFNNNFQALAARTGVTDDKVLIGWYEQALNTGILRKIYNQENVPTTIENYYDAAAKHDRFERRFRSMKLGNNSNNSNTKPNATQNEKASTGNRFRNTFNNFTQNQNNSSPPIPKMTPEERERCMREGRCFKCREKGHNSQYCKKFPSSTNRPFIPRNIRAMEPLQHQQEYYYPNPMTHITPQAPPIQTNPFRNLNNQSNPQPNTPGEHAANIRAILKGLSENEREEFYQSLDAEGF